jgi:uncharacterized membrane protein
MKTNTYNYIALFLIIFLFLFLFLSVKSEQKEGFLSGFHKMYRPYVRNARLYTTNKFNNISNKTYVVFKRWGLI